MIVILRFQVLQDYVCFIAPIDYCVESSFVNETFYANCSYFILIWFQPNSFGEMCFLEESYEKMQKLQILKILRVPSTRNQEYAFNHALRIAFMLAGV